MTLRFARRHLGRGVVEVPPEPADPGEVISLMHFDGAHASTTFTDEVGHVWSRTGGDAADLFISTTQSKFGGASARSQPGSGRCDLQPADYTPFLLGSGAGAVDFEMDFWLRRTSSTTSSEYMCSWQLGAATGPNFIIGGSTSSHPNRLRFAGTTGNVTCATSLALNQDYHVLINRFGGYMRIFLAGVKDGEGVMTATASNEFALFGGWYTQGRLRGYMDEFRFVRNPAERTANFTPPASPYTYP